MSVLARCVLQPLSCIVRLSSYVSTGVQVIGWIDWGRMSLTTVPRHRTLSCHTGFPPFDHPGFKIGKFGHLNETADPDRLSREVTAADEAALREAVTRYFPLAGATPTITGSYSRAASRAVARL